MARPELLDVRPAWGGGKLNATNALLEPLAPEETAELVDRARGRRRGGPPQPDPARPPAATRSSSRRWSRWRPRAATKSRCRRRSRRCSPRASTSSAAGGARRARAGRGRGPGLSPRAPSPRCADGGPVDGELVALVRKDLVRPEQPLLPDDDAYRFRHLLIRDTAYEALPKATRAELHERFADWLAVNGSGARRARRDPRLPPRAGLPLPRGARPARRPRRGARRAGGARLLAGGDHALERGDGTAVIRLLSRALALLPPADPSAPAAQLELARALFDQGDLERAVALLDEAVSAAREAGDERVLARSRIARIDFELLATPETRMTEGLADGAGRARRARPHRRRRRGRLGAARDRRAGRLAR